jgi:hypothetical protein
MTKYSDPAQQIAWLDAMAMHGQSTVAAKVTGISRTTGWQMGKLSEEGHPDLQEVEWGDNIQPFHLHLLDALDMAVEDVQQDMTRAAAQGRYLDTVWHGAYAFEDDEYAMSLSEKDFQDALDIGIVWHDKKKRVLNPTTGMWERVKIKTFIPPTVDGQSKILSSFAPETFGDKRRIDMNVNSNLGVTFVGHNFNAPPQVEVLAPEVPQIEYNDAGQVAEPYKEQQPNDTVIDEQPEEPVISEPATPEPEQPSRPSSLSPEQKAILERLRSPNLAVRKLAEMASQALNRPAKAAPVRPAPPVSPPNSYSNDQDDCVPRRPGGYKVV